MPMFITFYSFKGGVGRTLALANVATLLAEDATDPCRVLVWDFDLAAPGLQQVVGCSWKGNKAGFIDYVTKYIQSATTESIKEYIHPTATPGLDVLPAGYLDRSYSKKLERIRWREMYKRARGFDFIEATRKQIAGLDPPYDYVLIDSLTGYSDVGGICVNQLPDAVVLIFRLNRQNLSGITTVYNSIKRMSVDGRKVTQVIPVISPAWPFLAPEANAWITRARKLFKEANPMQISFEGGLTFGEKFISREKRVYATTSKVLADYERLTSRIRNLNPQDRTTIFRSLDDLIIDSPEKALDSCIGLVLARPQNPEYWDELVPIIARLRMTNTAVAKQGELVISKGCDADNPFALLSRAKLAGPETSDAAVNDLTRVIKLDPKITEAYMMRAAKSMQRRDYADAIEDLTRQIEARPATREIVMAYANRAECLIHLDRPKEAAADLSRAILLQPRNATLLKDRAQALFAAGEYEAALTDLNQAHEIARPGTTADASQVLKAHLLFAAGQTQEGIDFLSEMESHAKDTGGLLNIAEAYLTVDAEKSLRILKTVKPAGKEAEIAVLEHMIGILQGRDEAEKVIQSLSIFAEKLKKSTWSWFEIRQFLKWGAQRQLISERNASEIAHLLQFLEKQADRSASRSLVWGEMALELSQLRIPMP